MKNCLEIAAALSAITSGVLWFLSARKRVAWSAFGTLNGPAPGVMAQLNKQAQLNSYAALAAGVSAILQAAAIFPQ